MVPGKGRKHGRKGKRRPRGKPYESDEDKEESTVSSRSDEHWDTAGKEDDLKESSVLDENDDDDYGGYEKENGKADQERVAGPRMFGMHEIVVVLANMYVYMIIHACIHVLRQFIHTCVCMCAYMHVCARGCTYVSMRACMYACMHMRVCMHAWMYACICVCMYVCMMRVCGCMYV